MAKVSFNNNLRIFYPALKKSVDQYFASRGLKKTGNWKLYLKGAILIPLAISIYIFLLVGSYPGLIGIGLSVLLGMTLVSIAFNVMHDACHGSYSTRKWVNNVLGHTMNALGSSAYMWKLKHNILHHTYTNVDGMDDDIVKMPVLRLCSTQKWLPMHRYQFVYMFLIYGLSTILWVYLTDIVKYFSKKIVVAEMKMTTKDHIIFWATKVLYVGFYAALPIILVGWGPWLVGYLAVNITMGITLATVFQLAHIVEKTSFETAEEKPKVIEMEWAVHEIKTTANFAQKNKLISWFVGGLNFQVEHHLFPRISHIHYPAISNIVRETCKKYNLPYHTYPTMTSAIASHVRLMKQLGRKSGVGSRESGVSQQFAISNQ